MTWDETRQRWRLVRQAEAQWRAHPHGPLPWSNEYAATFESPRELVAAIRYRWTLRLQAQVDPELGGPAAQQNLERLLRACPEPLELHNGGFFRLVSRGPSTSGRTARPSVRERLSVPAQL